MYHIVICFELHAWRYQWRMAVEAMDNEAGGDEHHFSLRMDERHGQCMHGIALASLRYMHVVHKSYRQHA